MTDLDDFLAECDDVIDDWHGSTDSAAWAADGSHEQDTRGHYYGSDRLHPVAAIGHLSIAPVSDGAPAWVEITHLLSDIGGSMRDQWQPVFARFSEAVRGTEATFVIHDETADFNDARRPAIRRRGLDAQNSPYGPQRRSHR